jgi:hypothetical protein
MSVHVTIGMKMLHLEREMTDCERDEGSADHEPVSTVRTLLRESIINKKQDPKGGGGTAVQFPCTLIWVSQYNKHKGGAWGGNIQ